MKVLVALLFYVGLCAGNAIPSKPGDNSHHVEGESCYVWIPDGEGVPRLVDLEESADESFLNARNGANNAYWLFTRSAEWNIWPYDWFKVAFLKSAQFLLNHRENNTPSHIFHNLFVMERK